MNWFKDHNFGKDITLQELTAAFEVEIPEWYNTELEDFAEDDFVEAEEIDPVAAAEWIFS